MTFVSNVDCGAEVVHDPGAPKSAVRPPAHKPVQVNSSISSSISSSIRAIDRRDLHHHVGNNQPASRAS
jgi:hypothetical protein